MPRKFGEAMIKIIKKFLRKIRRKIRKLFMPNRRRTKQISESYARGINAEKRLIELINSYDKFPDFIIKGKHRLSGLNSEDDHNGIDLWIETIYGPIPFQIKNKRHGNIKKYHEKGIGFIAVCTNSGRQKKDYTLINDLLKEIGFILNKRGNL